MKIERKKGILIGVLVIALLCIVGYGTYSYYWTQGTYELAEENVYHTVLDARFYQSGMDRYLYQGKDLSLTCNNPDSNGEFSCYTSTSIYLGYIDFYEHYSFDLEVFDFELMNKNVMLIGNPVIDITESSETLYNITVTCNLKMLYDVTDDEVVYYNPNTYSDNVKAGFKIKVSMRPGTDND